MKSASVLNEFAGDPAMEEVRRHAGWKPVLATLLALVFSVTVFFSKPEPTPTPIMSAAAPASQDSRP